MTRHNTIHTYDERSCVRESQNYKLVKSHHSTMNVWRMAIVTALVRPKKWRKKKRRAQHTYSLWIFKVDLCAPPVCRIYIKNISTNLFFAIASSPVCKCVRYQRYSYLILYWCFFLAKLLRIRKHLQKLRQYSQRWIRPIEYMLWINRIEHLEDNNNNSNNANNSVSNSNIHA